MDATSDHPAGMHNLGEYWDWWTNPGSDPNKSDPRPSPHPYTQPNNSALGPSTGATALKSAIGGQAIVKVNNIMVNYNQVNRDVYSIYKNAKNVYRIDYIAPRVTAPLMTLATLSADWHQTKGRKLAPLDHYFDRPDAQWEAFEWDGWYRKRLITEEVIAIPWNDGSREFIRFQWHHDGHGRMYLPEIMGVRYNEAAVAEVPAYAWIQPPWKDSSNRHGMTLPNAYYTMLNPANRDAFGIAAFVGWNAADNPQPIADLRNPRTGRGLIWPYKYLTIGSEATTGTDNVYATVIYRYAPVALDAILYLVERALRMDAFGLSQATNTMTLHGLSDLADYRTWYKNMLDEEYDNDSDDPDGEGATDYIPRQ